MPICVAPKVDLADSVVVANLVSDELGPCLLRCANLLQAMKGAATASKFLAMLIHGEPEIITADRADLLER